MKRSSQALAYILSTIIIACLFATSLQVKAQTITVTNPAPAMPSFSAGLQQIYDSVAVSTNYALAFGGGRSTTGNKNLGFADYVYNVSQNVGLVVGYDYLWTAKKYGIASQANLIKGGISFSALIYPLKNFGLTNFAVMPFANGLVATGNGSASEIITAGGKFTFASFSGWNFGGVGFWETRKDAVYWTADYICAALEFDKGF